MVKHIHTHLLTLVLQHPEEPSRLLSQLFLFFTPNFYSSDTSFLTPRGGTWKWLLFRPYLTGKRPLLHKCGSKTHLRFVNNYSLSEFVIANIRHIFSVNFLFIIFFFFLAVCGKHPPWSVWRELLPCNETSCRSGIRNNNPHRRLHTRAIRIAVKCFYCWMWLQRLQSCINYRQVTLCCWWEAACVWHIDCFTWANELRLWSIREILHISPCVTAWQNTIWLLYSVSL